jgi:hypothetical protein
LLGVNAIKGIITFALGGLVLIFAFEFIQLFFTGTPANFGDIVNGLPLAFIGFLFVGIGLWAIIQDAMASRTK